MRPVRPRPSRRLLACAIAALLAAGPATPAAALRSGESPAQPAQVDPPPLPPVLWSESERAAGRGGDLDPGCAPVTLVAVPGTGETNAVRDPDVAHGRITPGLAADLRAGLGERAVRAVWLPYPSDAVATMGYAESRARGLAALHRETRKVGVLAVDMPRVTVDTFRRLRAAADGRDGAVLVDATGRSQLCCVLDVARVSAVAPAPAERHGLPVHRLLGRLSLAEVDADTDEARDIDYWSDLHDLDS